MANKYDNLPPPPSKNSEWNFVWINWIYHLYMYVRDTLSVESSRVVWRPYGISVAHSLTISCSTGAVINVDAINVLLSDGTYSYVAPAPSKVMDLTGANGVEGLDTGSLAVGWYHIWLIYNGTTTSTVASTSTTWGGVDKTNLAGYTWYGFVGSMYATSTTVVRPFKQNGKYVTFAAQQALSGGTSTSYSTTFATALNTILPSTAKVARGYLIATNNTAATTIVASAFLASDTGGFGEVESRVKVVNADASTAACTVSFAIVLTTAQEMAYKVSTANDICGVKVTGWEY